MSIFGDAPVPLTAKDVAEIARLLEESDFLELRIEHEGFKLTLKRGSARGAASDDAARGGRRRGGVGPLVGRGIGAGAARAGARTSPRRAPPTRRSSTSPRRSSGSSTAPRARAPRRTWRSDPRSRRTPIVGIIEVMKLMNSVRAEARGRVVEILVEDGAAVESGQVLLRLARGDRDG